MTYEPETTVELFDEIEAELLAACRHAEVMTGYEYEPHVSLFSDSRGWECKREAIVDITITIPVEPGTVALIGVMAYYCSLIW